MGSSGYKPEKRKITDPEMTLISKSICKISKSNEIITGFFIKLFKNDRDFFCLMTNANFITKEMLNKKEKINIYYDNEEKLKEIILNENERYIKDFLDIGINAIVIEIVPKDNIEKNYFLLPVIDYIYENNNLLNQEIILIQNKFYFTGKIKKINTNEFSYLINTEFNLSGNPIFLKNNIKVIGITTTPNLKESENYADFIGPIFNFFKNFDELKKENKNTKNKTDGIDKIDNDFTIDDLTDLITNANTSIEKELESFDNIEGQSDGKFINGKLEGSGKFIWENGCYYIGQFKNGKKNGKGIIYYKKGNIMYDGDFLNDKKEGNGKLILKNGQYYIGQFKKGKKHGKGIDYYKNGNIMYEGDYLNGKLDGNGKFIFKNGQYYIGQFKNGKRNGKGILYYKNGNIKCSTNIE